MTEPAITINDLGKMYRLYRRPADKVLDAFGINHYLFWRKKYYQEFWALRGLNLKVKKGERLGIIGRNGAGKSTLLKIITGNVLPTEGSVKVNGRVQALMELGTGFHPEFTGRQNIQASLAYQGLSPREIEEKEEEIIDFSELDEFIEQPIKTYSAGMYARLAFTVATVVEPEILIIDEVLGAGDAYFAGKCVERMKKLTEESGATVLFVSHDLGSVQALCNRVIWFHRGVLKADGEPLNVIKQYGAAVRQEEEIRLKARDLKLSKKQAIKIDSKQDLYQTFLFRLVGIDGGHPIGVHKIRSLVLYYGDDKVGEINVGAPMDNDYNQNHYIINEPGYMDWGEPSKDNFGYQRDYSNCQGKYAHAPFQFSIPKSYLVDPASLKLEIRADCEENCVATEVFIEQENKYYRLGILNSEQKINSFLFDSSLIIEKEYQIEQPKSFANFNSHEQKNQQDNQLQEIDEYGSQKEIIITKIEILNSLKESTKIIKCLEPFQVVVEYFAQINIHNPAFVFCIYLPSGITASQWLVSAKELGTEVVKGKGKIIFQGNSLMLGKGSYVASTAIFKWYPRHGVEPEAYHVLDRCTHFQVINSNETESIDYGICRQPIEAKLETE
ncbi:MAG: polysaccharide ABC transporter ATP-binding protein [Mastigocoleus sp. MO_167.B18]|uniref:ABC transporter ATP-binding protein n=1 Tax=Mastigocoleus sp. MO_188.B34 TaxID=3036635 RepID=UPI00260A2FC8|nr:polysaccharide ABC transporter ATP-binding protein [Mastigocoleus sp. MO_188.B34]MDJ0694076.1 polysaccharide ABC transporter ATP-binding protein [Mastigocoleus sp. MO_188.B34]MDJ0772107.1 polysaccharide ABC transporter ATP-binding protein [Mastigocoleus sp. MO_167.B18]